MKFKNGDKVRLISTLVTDVKYGYKPSKMYKKGEIFEVHREDIDTKARPYVKDKNFYVYSIEDIELVERASLGHKEAAIAYYEGEVLINEAGTKFHIDGLLGNKIELTSEFLTNTFNIYEKPDSLRVESLEYEIKLLDTGIQVGCQTISAEDALEIAKFINDNLTK